jgi:iron complex transport system substrate-binding protein
MEEVISRQPEIVLFSHTEDAPLDVAVIGELVGWRELDALHNGKAFTIDANLFNRPGPRLAEAARRLAALLHPDVLDRENAR